MKTRATKPYWVNKSNSFSFLSQLTTCRTKETFSVCLFIPVLTPYLFTPVTHLFFPLSLDLALPCGFLSHTGGAMALQQREKDLGDHLKPIMAALQPPRNSVTDGDLVFIAGVIGNTQTHTHTRNTHMHTHTYTSTYKEIDTFKCTHIRHSLCLHSGIDITLIHTHGQASQAAEKVQCVSCLQSKWRSQHMNQSPLSWEDK